MSRDYSGERKKFRILAASSGVMPSIRPSSRHLSGRERSCKGETPSLINPKNFDEHTEIASTWCDLLDDIAAGAKGLQVAKRCH